MTDAKEFADKILRSAWGYPAAPLTPEGEGAIKTLTELIEDRERRIRLETLEQARLAYDSHIFDSRWENPEECLICRNNVRDGIHLRAGEDRLARLTALRASVPAARAGDANELRYCGRCNQRRHFKDGKCEMCALQDSRDRRINAEDGDHYETERAGDAVCPRCEGRKTIVWADADITCPDCHGTGRASK